MRVETVNLSALAKADQVRVARVNGVALNRESDQLSVEELRQRAWKSVV